MALRFGAVLGAVVGIGLAAGTARAEDFTVGYSQFWGTNPFLVTMANGAKKSISEWADKGVKVDMILTNGGDTDTTKQVADLEDLYAQGVQGLILFPDDSIVLAEPVKNIVNRLMEDTPVAIPDIKGVFFFNQAVAQGAAAALAAANRTDVQLVSFDLDPVSYQMVKDGKILGLVVQDPFKMGYEGMNAMVTKLQGGTPVARMDIPTRMLTKDNAAEFAEDPQVTGK